MDILVCVKRVPDTGAKIVLTDDQQRIETRNLGFTVSPHEECAEEEAVQQIEEHGGSSVVLTLGPEDAVEQLRDAMSLGIDDGVLLETDGSEWDPIATSRAIVDAIGALRDEGREFDVLLFGNEAADSGDYQVGVRVAHALDLPCVTGIKSLEFRNGTAVAKREIADGWEIYDVPLPAVFTVKEGINVPRYPSLRGRMIAKRKQITFIEPQRNGGGLKKLGLKVPEEEDGGAEILGEGPEAAPKVVALLKELGVL